MQIKRAYNKDLKGYTILIDRLWPRGINKDKISYWAKDIAPSNDLRKWYHETNDYLEFKKRYFKELDQKDLTEFLKLLKKDPILVYGSKNKLNNATALKEYLTKS